MTQIRPIPSLAMLPFQEADQGFGSLNLGLTSEKCIRPGDRVRVFDPILWNGRDCACGCRNDCFRKPATVLRVYRYPNDGRMVADVRFDHRPERISHGHFVTWIDHLEAR